MSGPAYYTGVMNISMNEDWIVPFLYETSPDGGVTHTPIDLTGSTLMMEIRHQESDHEVVLSLASPDQGIFISDATGGAFTILITREQLAQFAPGAYVADLVRLMTNGYVERILDLDVVTVVEGKTR
jgi:hypothetical protein